MKAQQPGSVNPDMASNLERGQEALECLVLLLRTLLFKSTLLPFGGVLGLFECPHGIFGENRGVPRKGGTQPVPSEENLVGRWMVWACRGRVGWLSSVA